MAEQITILRIGIRRQLREYLRSDSEFDAFLIDNFPDIRSRLSTTMDRIAKENFLLENLTDSRIAIEQLQEWRHALSARMSHSSSSEQSTASTAKSSEETVTSLQTWTVKSALIIITLEILFFVMAPHLGFPLEASESIRLLEIMLPVFLFYLSSAVMVFFEKKLAAQFLSQSGRKILSLLIRGPLIVFIVASISAIGIFGYSNRLDAMPGEGLSPNSLAAILTISLSILCIASNSMISYLFSLSEP